MIESAVLGGESSRRSGDAIRIVSLLPSATEILYALGLGDSVVGVTHDCDFPLAAARKPPLIKTRVDPHASPSEIDRQVGELMQRGESIYSVDADLLFSLAPDLIVTQDLCHVCAASPDDLASALARLPKMPRVLTLAPHSLDDVWQDIVRVGNATGTSVQAETLTAELRAKVKSIELVVEAASNSDATMRRPLVLCLEWLDPFYVGGHWVPEMVSKAGGDDVLGRATKPSFKVSSEQIAASEADVILVMLCGYDAGRNASAFSRTKIPENWNALPVFRDRRIYAVDANGYFSRPGPRLAGGVELLFHLLHPEIHFSRQPEWTYLKL